MLLSIVCRYTDWASCLCALDGEGVSSCFASGQRQPGHCLSTLTVSGCQQNVSQEGWRVLQHEYLDVPQVINHRPQQQLFVQGANALLCHIGVQPLCQHKPSVPSCCTASHNMSILQL